MKYFGYYADINNDKLSVTPAAVDKMNYISDVLTTLCPEVEIISAAMAAYGRQKKTSCVLKNGVRLWYFSSKHHANKIFRVPARWIFNIKLLLWSMKNIEKKEKIIVYHSLGYIWLFEILKKIKKVYIILEMEEIYSDVTENSRVRKRELEFAKNADAFIFPTKLMDSKVNSESKKSIVVHGVYKPEERLAYVRNDTDEASGKKVIHCVYAGTFDPRKGGVYAAIDSCRYLPSNYHMHILGFGTDDDIKNINKAISNIKGHISCRLTYEGMYKGKEYCKFIQGCHIGLSTQNPSAAFNDTSFPSKILSYLSNGLHVVSIKIPVVSKSDVSHLITYYSEQSGEQIANAILSVNTEEEYDSRKYLKRLDEQLKKDFKELL